MAACVNDPRTDQISRCTDELARCAQDMKAFTGDSLSGPFLGWMDWYTELQRLLYNWEEQ
jgi:hypothetical protein